VRGPQIPCRGPMYGSMAAAAWDEGSDRGTAAALAESRGSAGGCSDRIHARDQYRRSRDCAIGNGMYCSTSGTPSDGMSIAERRPVRHPGRRCAHPQSSSSRSQWPRRARVDKVDWFSLLFSLSCGRLATRNESRSELPGRRRPPLCCSKGVHREGLSLRRVDDPAHLPGRLQVAIRVRLKTPDERATARHAEFTRRAVVVGQMR